MAVKWDDQKIMEMLGQAAAKGVFAATEALRTGIIERIKQQPKTGNVYRRRGVVHQASAPGESPATDTGNLINSINTAYRTEQPIYIGTVTISAAYAAALEYGTARVAARPYVRPTIEQMRKELEKNITIELSGVLK